MSKKIGISRNVNLEWLDKVAELYIEGKTIGEIRSDLDEYLAPEIVSDTNRRKTRSILTNIWVGNPGDKDEFREIAVRLFKSDREVNKLLAHWCLMLISYPVFADICSTIGRMDRNMFAITSKEIKSRMFDLWGERSTLKHAIDKNIQTLKDLGILYTISNVEYGINRFEVNDNDGLILIANALVCIRKSLYISVEDLNESPEFFPFIYCITTDILIQNDSLFLDRFGGELVVSKA